MNHQPHNRSRLQRLFTSAFTLCAAGLLLAGGERAQAAIFAADIQRLYVTYWARPADPTGLSYWLSVADSATAGGQSDDAVLLAISNNFGASAEYTSQFSGLNSDGIINKIYLNLFSHAPDAGALV